MFDDYLRKKQTHYEIYKTKNKRPLSISYSSDETAHDQIFLVVPIAIFPTP
jgi:hypothetical protein